MSFTPHKSDDGAVLPHEYLPAAAGGYKAGQLLNTSGGRVAPIGAAFTTVPPYLCMADAEVAEAGGLLPVTRVSRGVIYETALSAAAAGAVPGGRLQVTAGGLEASTGAGAFEVVSSDGTEAGSAVRGRFV